MNRLKMLKQLKNIANLGLLLGLGNLNLAAQVAPTNRPSGQPIPAAPANLPPPPANLPRPAPTAPPIAVPFDPTGAIMDANQMPLRVMGGGVFQLANVTMDKRRRTVSFPAVVNLNQGTMEYFLVTAYGKVHESILRTETMPHHIHIAMLLMDVNDANNLPTPGDSRGSAADGPAKPQARQTTISTPDKESLPGDKIAIEVSWNIEGKETIRRAEDLVLNLQKKSAMDSGHWAYTGSQVLAGNFGAQVSGSLASLITDREALINNVGAGHENDDIWGANTKNLPPPNTPVRVTLKLEGGKSKN